MVHIRVCACSERGDSRPLFFFKKELRKQNVRRIWEFYGYIFFIWGICYFRQVQHVLKTSQTGTTGKMVTTQFIPFPPILRFISSWFSNNYEGWNFSEFWDEFPDRGICPYLLQGEDQLCREWFSIRGKIRLLLKKNFKLIFLSLTTSWRMLWMWRASSWTG